MKLKLSTALITAAIFFAPLSLVAEKAQNPADAKRAAVAVFGKLPLSFEPTESSARFLAHSGGYSVTVGARESAVAVTDAKSGKTETLRFAFQNANPAAPLEAIEPQPGVTNYYLGQDSSKWRLGVKNYAKVRALGVYPGVDVVYYGDHRRLEFDFVVAPKADPRAIALTFSGMEKFYKDASGDLVAEVNGQPVHFVKPYAYQTVAGVSKPVAVDYELASAGNVRLQVGDYDSNAELIIDPVVSYATYLGGSKVDVANGIAVDNKGSAYITGQTCSSTDFPKTTIPSPNPSGLIFQGACDAYVTKFSPDGSALAYTTILGGSLPPKPGTAGTAVGNGIALDLSDNPQIYVVGSTNIEDLPLNAGGYRNAYQGGDSKAFIAILLPSGKVQLTTYLGGSSADFGYGITLDHATPANIIVVGQTCSQDFPGYNAFETKIEACVAFVTKLDNTFDIPAMAWGTSAISPAPTAPAGEAYFFSEFYGGQPIGPWQTAGAWTQFHDYPLGAIVTDFANPPNSQIALNAGTSGPYFPPAPPLPSVPNWNTGKGGTTPDIPVNGIGGITWQNAGLSPNPKPPIAAYSEAYGVAVDPPGDIFVAGGTNTKSLDPFSRLEGTGAWVLKISGQTGAFIYGTVLEATPTDSTSSIDTARAVAVDASGRAYVTGTTTGSLYTTGNAYKSAIVGGQDAFLVRVNIGGTGFDYATYLGGTGNDQGLGVAVDGSFQAYVTGGTESTDFPLINPLQDPKTLTDISLSGTEGAFITKFTLDGSALILSAYMGGSVTDQGNAIALDPTNLGNMYVAGNTTSPDLLTTLLKQPMTAPSYVPPQTTYGANDDPGDAFVAMIPAAQIPRVTVTPGSLNFSIQDVGTTSKVLPVLFTIQGTAAVTIQNISFNNPQFGQSYVNAPNSADCTQGAFGPNATPPSVGCTVWVVFTPTTQGQQSGSLSITDGASSKTHVISLTGQGAVPSDHFSVPNIVFSAQIVSTTSTAQSVNLTNSGLGVLNINGITISANSSEFSTTDNCGGQLAAKSTCTINVIFSPSGTGLRTGTLTITDNATGSPHSIWLSGTGTGVGAPTITPASLSLTFAGQAINATSSAQQVTLTNTTGTALNIGSVAISGTNPGDFNQSNNCGALLLANGSCVVNVTFTPTALNGRSASLVFTDNAANSPQAVALSGSGIAAAGTIALSPATLTFGNQAVGSISKSQTVTLTNSSLTSALSFTIGTTGANKSDFAQTNNCLPLAASASCTITVTFTPSAAGAESAALTVTGSASNSPQSVALTGTGTGTVGPIGSNDFTLAFDAPGGVSVTEGITAVFGFSVTPAKGSKDTVAFTCSGPVGSNCSVSPASLTMDGSTVRTMSLSVNTTGGNGTSANAIPGGLTLRSIFLAVLPFSLMGMLLINKRRGIWLALMLVALSVALGSVGCGGSGSSSPSGALAPGSYPVTLTATSSVGTPMITSLTLVVNKK